MSNLNNTILELLKQGFTLEYIMKNLGVAYNRVNFVARNNNLQKRTVYITWEQINKEDDLHNAR
jgi:orotate phosphoribosyltransferase-like protein